MAGMGVDVTQKRLISNGFLSKGASVVCIQQVE